ncbi:MAG: hypothetical protein DI537_23100 [Stutzerimonas stutzeri]|nr:MAG: hypothetical protein DI537_23100 [Stutzerimonas stutzeri]
MGASSEALFGLANPPKRFVRFPEGNHENLPAHGSVPEIRRFLADLDTSRLAGSETVTAMAQR